jgi:hypothetical protein
MSRRSKIIIAVILILILLLALLWYFLRPTVSVVADLPIETTVNGSETGGLIDGRTTVNVNRPRPVVNENAPDPVLQPPPPDERSNLRRVAAAFAERFGSFSNQSDFENIIDLKAFMTDAMSAWADGYVADQRAAKKPSAVYYGLTTRSISTEVVSFDEAAGEASVRVKAQRREESGETGESRVYYQDIIIDFEEVADVWKVDSAVWQPL